MTRILALLICLAGSSVALANYAENYGRVVLFEIQESVESYQANSGETYKVAFVDNAARYATEQDCWTALQQQTARGELWTQRNPLNGSGGNATCRAIITDPTETEAITPSRGGPPSPPILCEGGLVVTRPPCPEDRLTAVP